MAGLGAAGGGLLAGPSLAALGAGLLAGVLGGAGLVASGTVDFSGDRGGAAGPAVGAGLEVVPCPERGPVIGSIPRDQQVLVTARSADGGWLQLHWPVPGVEYAWTKAGPLRLDGDPATLPVATCEAAPTPSPRPTVEPTPTPVAIATATPAPSPSPSPTPTAVATAAPTATASARPTATPTARPNAAPVVSAVRASTKTIFSDRGSYCPDARKTVTITVTASDDDGIAGVTLAWRKPGATTFNQKPMTRSGSRWVATLDTKADGITRAGKLNYYVIVRDANAVPKTTRSPRSGSLALEVKVCANTGPTITQLTASPTSIIADPLTSGCAGSTLSELQAQASDVDGVASIDLFFRKPGAADYEQRAFTRDGDIWYSFINTVSSVDDIRDGGLISWYVVATDTKGKATKSDVLGLPVNRCDSPASFDFAGVTGRAFNDRFCSPNTLSIPVYASDPDNAAAGDKDSRRLDVVLSWRATVGRQAISGQTRAIFQEGNAFLVSLPLFTGWLDGGAWPIGGYAISYTATSTDVYGGTSRSFTGSSKFSVLACIR
jgi:hypothetical protein